MDDECKHLLPVGQCAYCKPPPAGVLPQGWRATGGSAYHNDARCEWLIKGQDFVHRTGREVGDVVPVRWADVGPEKLQPCGHCCTERWLRVRGKARVPARPCLVQDGEQWVPGTLVWEARPRGDGMWWASVRFSRSGELVTEERSQREVQPRRA